MSTSSNRSAGPQQQTNRPDYSALHITDIFPSPSSPPTTLSTDEFASLLIEEMMRDMMTVSGNSTSQQQQQDYEPRTRMSSRRLAWAAVSSQPLTSPPWQHIFGFRPSESNMPQVAGLDQANVSFDLNDLAAEMDVRQLTIMDPRIDGPCDDVSCCSHSHVSDTITVLDLALKDPFASLLCWEDVQVIANAEDSRHSGHLSEYQQSRVDHCVPIRMSNYQYQFDNAESQFDPGMYASPTMQTVNRIPEGAMTVEELEAQLMGMNTNYTQQPQPFRHSPPQDPMLVNPLIQHSPYLVQNHIQHNSTHSPRVGPELQEQQFYAIMRTRREARMREYSRYNGIMSQREKDLIARIQISQLVTADPIAHDYYFQLRARSKQLEPVKPSDSPPNLPLSASNRHPQNKHQRRYQPGLLRRAMRGGSLQGQIDRIVQHTMKKNKSTEFLIDGALGKIALKTTKNPRQQLHLTTVTTTPKGSIPSSPINPRPTNFSPMLGSHSLYGNKVTRRKSLQLIEQVYDLVIQCECLNLRRPGSTKPFAQGEEDHYDLGDAMQEWEDECTGAYSSLWDRLQQADDDKSPIFHLLSASKGKKLWPRIAQLLNPDHYHKLLLDIFMHAQNLAVVRQASIPALYAAPQLFPGHTSSKPTIDVLLQFVGDVEDFMHFVLPSLIQFIADSPWAIVSSNLSVMIDRGDVYKMCASKVGLAFLTMLVSRSEILNQSGNAPGWSDLYLRLFNMLQGHYFTALFPVSIKMQLPSLTLRQLPLSLIPVQMHHLINQTTNSGGPVMPSASEILDFYLTDDAHVWQFLAALAVAASVEQQTVLVTEVRDRILTSIGKPRHGGDVQESSSSSISIEKADRALMNVNILLHALGLDANQIQTAM